MVRFVSGPCASAREALTRAAPAATTATTGAAPGAGEGADAEGAPRDPGELQALEAAREAKYREIRDCELDFRTGKLSREDYEAIDAQLRAEAIEILDRLERGGWRRAAARLSAACRQPRDA